MQEGYCHILIRSSMIGSSLHAMKVLQHPRWEDFTYEYIHENPMGWFGDGWTANERNNCVNVDYLDYENIDFPPAAEPNAKSDSKLGHGMTNGV
jgi:hypothetical protein